MGSIASTVGGPQGRAVDREERKSFEFRLIGALCDPVLRRLFEKSLHWSRANALASLRYRAFANERAIHFGQSDVKFINDFARGVLSIQGQRYN